MNIQAAIAQVVAGQSLSRADMETVMRTVMQGEATEAQIGGPNRVQVSARPRPKSVARPGAPNRGPKSGAQIKGPNG